MRKGHYFSIEGLRKGYLFCQERYLKGNWYKPRGGGGASRTKRCWAPPPPGLLLSFVCFCLRLTQGIAQKEHDITVETFASCFYFLCVGLVTEKERGIRKIYLKNMTRKKGSRLNTQAQANSTAYARNFICFHLFCFHTVSATYVCYESSKPRITFFPFIFFSNIPRRAGKTWLCVSKLSCVFKTPLLPS